MSQLIFKNIYLKQCAIKTFFRERHFDVSDSVVRLIFTLFLLPIRDMLNAKIRIAVETVTCLTY